MFLVFPSFRISYTWFSFYVVEPHVFCTWTVSPSVLTCYAQVWQPMHLSKFNTIAICALIFKPIYLLHLSHCYIYVTLISYWSIIVKVITNLCVTTYKLWFQMNFVGALCEPPRVSVISDPGVSMCLSCA